MPSSNQSWVRVVLTAFVLQENDVRGSRGEAPGGAILNRLTNIDRLTVDGSAKLCHLKAICEAGRQKAPKIKKAEDFSSAFLRLVPSPRYFAKFKPTEAGSRCRRM